jgi:hypothetical protein
MSPLADSLFYDMSAGGRKNGMSHHTARLGNSKLREDGGRNIRQRWIRRINAPIAQQNARHQRVVHAMIAAPWIRIGLEDVSREVAQNGLPSCAVTAVVADDEIWPLVRIWPLINLTGAIHARDRRLIVLRIAHGEQLVFNFFQQRI